MHLSRPPQTQRKQAFRVASGHTKQATQTKTLPPQEICQRIANRQFFFKKKSRDVIGRAHVLPGGHGFLLVSPLVHNQLYARKGVTDWRMAVYHVGLERPDRAESSDTLGCGLVTVSR